MFFSLDPYGGWCWQTELRLTVVIVIDSSVGFQDLVWSIKYQKMVQNVSWAEC